MAARHWFRKFGEVVNQDQDASMAVDGDVDFFMVVLDQFIGIPTMDLLVMDADVPRIVTNLLARKALADVFSDTAANTRPRVFFLYSCHNFNDALVSQCIMRTEQNLMLVQLGHHDHAGSFV